MRAIGIGVGLTVMAAGAAWAEIHVDNKAQGWTEPKREVQLAQWPRDSKGQRIFGKVLLDCGVTAGHADDCKVEGSEPANPLLEKGALALAPLFTSNETGKVRHQLEVSILYDAPPDWLQKPSPTFLGYAMPLSAWANSEGGTATVKCQVNKQGLAQDCTVQSEEPAGDGFGAAALSLTPTFLFKPATANGQPVEAYVSIPINFQLQGKPAPGTSYNTAARGDYILSRPYWSKAPDTSRVLAQLKKKVGDKFADGKVVFMCSLNKTTGRLNACHVVNASEGMSQFKSVGSALADDFQASPDTLNEVKSWPEGVNPIVFLPFSFPDMASATLRGRYLDHVHWTSNAGASPLFPEAAAKAGLKTGMATVDCLVKNAGGLTDCTVVNESTPGVGLGDLAKKIAATATLNPWTDEGLPADGAHVRVPIRMDYTPPAPTPATKP